MKILKNLARISGGELQFGRMADVVDLEAEKKTALAFDLFGETFQWALAFDGDWVDPTLFSQLVSVISKHSTSGKIHLLQHWGSGLRHRLGDGTRAASA